MFEKLFKYSDIKGHTIEVFYKGSAPYFKNKLVGICVGNPILYKNSIFNSLFHSLAIEVKTLPNLVSSSFYITFSHNEPERGHIIYIPHNSIKSLNVLKPDTESKMMLFWMAKEKNILPLDVIKHIYQFVNGWTITLPVEDF